MPLLFNKRSTFTTFLAHFDCNDRVQLIHHTIEMRGVKRLRLRTEERNLRGSKDHDSKMGSYDDSSARESTSAKLFELHGHESYVRHVIASYEISA